MMPAQVMVQPRLLSPFSTPLQSNMNFFTSSGLSLALPTALEAPRDATQSADSEQIKTKEDEDESKSSSDNAEGGSGDDQDADHRPKKKRYHRHSQHQIQEMERVFKECPHPDEKQRLELSRDLKLDPRQVKFWFQNKRTQVKAQHERHDNAYLRSENEKLRAENLALRDAMWNAACPNCGGPANPAEMSFDEHQLRLENVKLREEIDRISAIAAKHIGRPVSTFTGSTSTASSTLNLGFSAPQPSPDILAPGPSLADVVARSLGVSEAEKPMMIELAVAAMEELTQVAQASEPLWVTDPLTGIEVIDNEQYLQRFPRAMGAAALGLKSEGTRETSLVILNASSLVEIFMDVTRWTEMFSCIVARALLVEVLSSGVGGTQEGAMQLMYAEFQLPSPLVASREHYFLRYAKRVNHLWVVVDVSVENLRGHAGAPPALRRCKRRPSGCIIEEMPTGYSKVTWVEHGEAEERGVHRLYQQLVSSGMAFGAQRWLATLTRQCERMAALMANTTAATRDLVSPAPEGRRSLLRLAQRMTNTFSTGVSASVAHTWITLSGSGGDDVRVLIRKSVDDPGRPPGIVLCAATSLWLPRPPARVFDFLRDERFRTEWDILSNMGVVEEMVHVAKGQDAGNSISLLRVNASGSSQPNMLIFQDCCTDQSCSLVVYAPVDVAAMTAVLNGGDPETVALLPSGFAVLPDTPQRRQLHLGNSSVTNSAAASVPNSPGSLLTVAFQILVDHTPTAKLSLGSVATVNNLISSTVLRIRNALACDAP